MKIKELILILFSPETWVQNNEYSKIWDKKLTMLMSKYKFKQTTDYTTNLGGYNIWIANHPYASFTINGLNIRPKRITILKARDKYIADILDTLNENQN